MQEQLQEQIKIIELEKLKPFPRPRLPETPGRPGRPRLSPPVAPQISTLITKRVLSRRLPIAWKDGTIYITVRAPYQRRNIRVARKISTKYQIVPSRDAALDILEDYGSNITEDVILDRLRRK